MACRWKTVACVLSGLALWGVLAPVWPSAMAAEPIDAPLLRVETDGHTSLIRRIAVDAARSRVITAGDDKTVRIWQMPEQHLVRTLRVPIDEGHEGQLFGLALSPDGNTIAVGGWTGWDWDGKASIYFFDAASGELTRRIGELPDAVHALAWSPDGAHLAVGLQGRAGLQIIRVADGQVVARDIQYRDKLTDLHFSSRGRLAAASLDGMVRLYDADFRLIGRRVVPGGKQPITVRFSPDASLLAVGFYDAPAVSVVAASDLNLAFQAQGADGAGQQKMLAVGWSADGKQLFAAGDNGGASRNELFRWEASGRGALSRIPAADNRIAEIQAMPGGQVVFAAEDPGFGVVGPGGKLEAFKRPDILDFTGAHGKLLASRDGAVVSYPLSPAGNTRHSFAVRAKADDNPGSGAPAEQVFAPTLSSPIVQLENWQDNPAPLINGKRPAFDDYEVLRSYALTPDGTRVLLGTEWALRLVDDQARELWSVKLAAVARAVNITLNGRLAVAALSDGSLRWYAMRDGREVFAYFPHRNGKDWIAWDPRGYYSSSYFGDNYVGWHVNRGRDMLPDFYRAVQFDRILYRPDLVLEAFNAAAADDPAEVPRGKGAALFDIARLREIAPPRLRAIPGSVEERGGTAMLNLILYGEQGGAPTRDIAVYVNGIPVTPGSERQLSSQEGQQFRRSVQVPISERQNQIRVEAFNGLSMGVDETYVSVAREVSVARQSGDLYVLAIGVNQFPALPAETNLAFAAQDAEAMAKALAERGAKVFRKVYTKLITDHSADKPLREVITKSLEFFRPATGQDTVVVFLASHGISDRLGNYYFVPRDASIEDIDRLVSGGTIETLVPWTTFFNGLRMTAGRRLLIVDTCQASRIQGRFESHAMLKRSAASLFSLMLASKGGEYSQEHAATGHGLFTYSLLSAMSGNADSNHDGILTQEEVFASAASIVARDLDKRTGPQTPQLVAPDPLGGTPLVSTRRN